jgi:hypothetical protein
MTTRAREQMVAYAADQTHVREGWTCESAARMLVDRSKRLGGFERTLAVEIVGVNVQGDRATASIRTGPRRAVSTISLAKEDGEWKLASTPGRGG